MQHHRITESLKKRAKTIHSFGLGFIQLKLDDTFRLHFYVPEVQITADEESPHNHRYNFESTIIDGRFKQTFWDLDWSGDTHIVTLESCKKGVEAPNKKLSCSAVPFATHDYGFNDAYYLDHNTFHTVKRESAQVITLVKRSRYRKEFAEVANKVGEETKCPFSANMDEKTLWELVDRSVKNCHSFGVDILNNLEK